MMTKRTLIACVLAALVVAPAAVAANFSMYVALGDSLTAGYIGGGLTQYFQERSYPAQLAKQAGAPLFEQPLVDWPGIPPVLELQHLVPSPVIVPASSVPGAPLNAEYAIPYNNLGVPGSTLYDLLFTTGNIFNLLAGNTDNAMHDLILRDGEHTAIQQAIGLQPTFVTMWIGNNDILGAAVFATPVEGVTMTPVANFGQMYQQALGALATNTSADIVVMTLPNVTAIPFVTTLDPFLDVPGVGHVPLIGSNGPLPEDAYVTLGASSLLAQGIGIPVELGGTGIPLPEDMQVIGGQAVPGVVLRQEEVQIINDRVAAFNGIIKDTAAAMGAKVFDVNALFNRLVTGDFWILGGITLNPGFLTGGIFSYDGVHPQAIGYGLIAMELIDFVNQQFGENIPQINMNQLMHEQGPFSSGTGQADVVHAFTADAMHAVERAFPAHTARASRAPAARRSAGNRRSFTLHKGTPNQP